jgi:cell fate regulator YaaT (PSP1 superfamily)
MQSGSGFGSPEKVHQDNYYVRQSSALPLNLQRHNSTGSPHFLVNEWGEIVGHASPVITNNSLEFFAQAESRNNFTPTRPQRANSHSGQLLDGNAGHFNGIPPQHGTSLNFNFNPNPFHNDNVPPPADRSAGSIGDGRMEHYRNNTEPIPLILFRQNSGGNLHPKNLPSGTNDTYSQDPVRDNTNQGVEVKGAEGRGSDLAEAVGGKNPSPSSYAAKLMMPRPQPALDQTKGRITSQPPSAGTSLSKSGPRMIYNVKFKRSQKNFVLDQRITREVKIGCYVKVEADRGEDLGIVMSIIPVEKFIASNRHRYMAEVNSASGDLAVPSHASTNIGDMKRIMRVATHDEISLLEVKRDEEEELLKICSTKARQRGLQMSVVDAEYQFDRNKLTFFFQAEGRIDFRELVRDLFSMYKTRIWMEQIDKNGSTLDETDERLQQGVRF